MSVVSLTTGTQVQRLPRVNWKALLRHHPFFFSLTEPEIDELVGEGASTEADHAEGALILTEGEPGQSVYLIGLGSARVILDEAGGREVTLATLSKGDLVGETALLDPGPRSAKVMAYSHCRLLEIRGQVFLDILARHPQIEFAILSKLVQRLRGSNDQLRSLKVTEGHEALKLLEARLDAEIRVFDASLRAAQAVFDQTKVRTDEVIASADRSRTRITSTVSAIATIVAIASGLLGATGLKQLWDVQEAARKVQEFKTHSDELSKQLEELKAHTSEAKRTVAREFLLPAFSDAVRKGAVADAYHYYGVLQESGGLDLDVFRLLNEIEDAMLSPGAAPVAAQARAVVPDYRAVLGRMVNDATDRKDKIAAYYLLLTNQILLSDKGDSTASFTRTLSEFETYVKPYATEAVFSRVEREGLFAQVDGLLETSPQKRGLLERVRRLVPGEVTQGP